MCPVTNVNSLATPYVLAGGSIIDTLSPRLPFVTLYVKYTAPHNEPKKYGKWPTTLFRVVSTMNTKTW